MITDRFAIGHRKATMKAVITNGNGGYDKLVFRVAPIPDPEPGEVLVRVLAAGVNNNEINTRLGWYSSTVTGGSAETAAAGPAQRPDGGWNAATPFPLIQGTDCCGSVVSTHGELSKSFLGKRVLIRPCMRPQGFGSIENIWMGSDFDGAFAEYVKACVRR